MINNNMRIFFIFILAMLLFGQAHARGLETQEATELQKRGIILPLKEILEKNKNTLLGDIVRIDLGEDDGEIYYEVKTLDKNGRRFDFYIDAKTGYIVEIKAK